MEKDDPPPESYLIDFANAFRIYKDCDIARDIANIRQSQNKNNPTREKNDRNSLDNYLPLGNQHHSIYHDF